MYTSPTYGLAYQTGNYVDTPINQVGFITGIQSYGVLVRMPGPGRVDPRCVTPKASSGSLWVFQPHELTKTNPPKEELCVTSLEISDTES